MPKPRSIESLDVNFNSALAWLWPRECVNLATHSSFDQRLLDWCHERPAQLLDLDSSVTRPKDRRKQNTCEFRRTVLGYSAREIL